MSSPIAPPAGTEFPAGVTSDEDTPEEACLKEAMRAVLLKLLDGPLTQRTLLTIEATAKASHELIIARKNPKAKRRRGPVYESVSDDEYGTNLVMANGPVGQSNGAETFGATLIRELIAVAQDMHKPKATLSELVLSAKHARDLGMAEVADQIEAQLKSMAAGSLPTPQALTNPARAEPPPALAAHPPTPQALQLTNGSPPS